jgi:hypothetical protein
MIESALAFPLFLLMCDQHSYSTCMHEYERSGIVDGYQDGALRSKSRGDIVFVLVSVHQHVQPIPDLFILFTSKDEG